MDDKNKTEAPTKKEEQDKSESSTWVEDMKQDLENYIEEQGIYIRQ